MSLAVILTQYKRNHVREQLIAIKNQTLKPSMVVVFQNGNHQSIDNLKKEFDFMLVKSDYNTKYFGRFAYAMVLPVEYVAILDDDIIPGKNCLKRYMEECKKKNGIIGGNGRIAKTNSSFPNNFNGLNDFGLRGPTKIVDFVGHLWMLKREWLHYMFAIKPCTYETGEDMHLCFSCKHLAGIKSYICQHKTISECSDIRMNGYALDQHASFRTTSQELRTSVEKYFVNNYNLKFITHKEYKECT